MENQKSITLLWQILFRNKILLDVEASLILFFLKMFAHKLRLKKCELQTYMLLWNTGSLGQTDIEKNSNKNHIQNINAFSVSLIYNHLWIYIINIDHLIYKRQLYVTAYLIHWLCIISRALYVLTVYIFSTFLNFTDFSFPMSEIHD